MDGWHQVFKDSLKAAAYSLLGIHRVWAPCAGSASPCLTAPPIYVIILDNREVAQGRASHR